MQSAIAGLICGVLVLTGGPAALAADGSPRQTVEHFQAALLDVMKNANSLGMHGRYARLAPAVDRAFDLTKMIQVATGSAWRSATEAQRKALYDAFRRVSIGTYASQFDGWSGQAFEVLGVQPGPQQMQLVATRITKGAETEAKLTYVVQQTDGKWRIVDVLLDGSISQLAVRRSEYRRELKEHGADGLVAVLNRQADGLLSK